MVQPVPPDLPRRLGLQHSGFDPAVAVAARLAAAAAATFAVDCVATVASSISDPAAAAPVASSCFYGIAVADADQRDDDPLLGLL